MIVQSIFFSGLSKTDYPILFLAHNQFTKFHFRNNVYCLPLISLKLVRTNIADYLLMAKSNFIL